jgi:hypothetical protein
MKLNQSTNKMGKRTCTLKELAQKDFVIVPKETPTDLAPIFNLVNIQEDLMEDDENRSDPSKESFTSNNEPPRNWKVHTPESLTLPIDLLNHLIKKEIGKTSKTLDLEEVELQAWIDLQAVVPKQILLALLRIAREYSLDPLKEEVSLALYDNCHWHAYITVDGYSKILNNHPAFDGIHFTQSEERANGIPIWMECTIYRKDRSKPIVIREYFEEVKGEQAIWQKMPRRMLRHRVIQQCARLAIG